MNFFTLLTSALIGSIFIIITTLFRRRSQFILHHGVVFLVFLLIASVLRLLCAFELPFTKIIYFPEYMIFIFQKLYTPIEFTTNIKLTVLEFISALWLGVASYFLVKLFSHYIVFFIRVKKMPVSSNPKAICALKRVLSDQQKNTKFFLIQDDEIDTPLLLGFFKPIILLPNIDFTENEFHTIFLHECSHFYNKDIWTKFVTEIVCAIYWWNPFVYLLRRDLKQVLELHCDAYVVSQLNEDFRIPYIRSIIKICRQDRKTQQFPVFSVGMTNANKYTDKLFEQRTDIILEYQPLPNKKALLVKCGYLLLTIIIFVASFSFVAQPQFDMQSVLSQDEVSEFPYIFSNNTFIVEDENGDFKLFVDNEFIEIIPKDARDELMKNADIHFYTEKEEDKIK